MIVLHLLASYALCFGLMNEKISEVNRWLYRLPVSRSEDGNLFERMFRCSFCTGFHTGLVVWILAGGGTASEAILFSLASSAFCFILDTLLLWIER